MIENSPFQLTSYRNQPNKYNLNNGKRNNEIPHTLRLAITGSTSELGSWDTSTFGLVGDDVRGA